MVCGGGVAAKRGRGRERERESDGGGESPELHSGRLWWLLGGRRKVMWGEMEERAVSKLFKKKISSDK